MTTADLVRIEAWLGTARGSIPVQAHSPTLCAVGESLAEIRFAVGELRRAAGTEEMMLTVETDTASDIPPLHQLRTAVAACLDVVQTSAGRHSGVGSSLHARLTSLRARVDRLDDSDFVADERPRQECVAVSATRGSFPPCLTSLANLAPDGWRQVQRPQHFVQLYEEDASLLHALAEYIADGFWQGDRSIVIATPAHREALEQHLQATNVDLVSATITHRYLALDAADTLATFMRDGMPDPTRFHASIGSLTHAALRRGQPVRMFGEMVALLLADGNRAGAARLEALWNELLAGLRVSLFCAYPASCVCGDNASGALAEICRAHAYVIPPESYAA